MKAEQKARPTGALYYLSAGFLIPSGPMGRARLQFTDSEGAGAHCQVGAGRMAFARIYDWLDRTFGLVEEGA